MCHVRLAVACVIIIYIIQSSFFLLVVLYSLILELVLIVSADVRGFGLSSSLLALCSAGLQGSLKQRHDISPFHREHYVSLQNPKEETEHTQTHMRTFTQASLATHSLTPPPHAPCTPPSSPQLLLLMPSEERSCIERELETMHVLSKDLLALTSTWTFSAVLLGLDRE